MEPLDDESIRTALAGLKGWTYDGTAIRRELRLPDFRSAIDLIVRIAGLAESADHHPELHNVHSRLTVALSTHEAGGVTDLDLDLARAIEALVAD
jgi:4a-hydroxytetrahydrobiopterin dehydratase